MILSDFTNSPIGTIIFHLDLHFYILYGTHCDCHFGTPDTYFDDVSVARDHGEYLECRISSLISNYAKINRLIIIDKIIELT